MHYISDRLSDFEFHDAQFTACNIAENRFTAQVKFLNIRSNARQNPFDNDMEIEDAQIVLDGFKVISYEHGRAWQTDENGEMYTKEPQLILQEELALQEFKEQLNAGITIFDFDKYDETAWFIDAMANDPFFTLVFTFDSVSILWDSYKKYAWYAE